MTTPLPPQGSPEPDEKLPGEVELAALYRQLPQSGPSPALDAAVLHAAAQALAPGRDSPAVLRERRKAARERGDWVHPKQSASLPLASSPGGSRRRPRWLIALSSAATLLLAAGLAWHMRGLPSMESAPAAVDSSAPAQAAAAAPMPAAPPAAVMQQAEPVPPPLELPKQPPPKMVVASSRVTAANTLRKAAADQRAERASSKVQAADGLTRDAPAPVAAPAAAPSVTLQETANDSAVAQSAAAEAAPGMPAAVVAAPAPAELAVNEATMPNANDTPAQELDKIRQLFAQGHAEEAHRRLVTFQHAHPQWNLPPELRVPLRKP